MNLSSSRLAVIGVGAVLIAAVFAGCGGSDDSGSLSKDDFIAQSDQICADVNSSIKEHETAFDAALEKGDTEAAADSLAASRELIGEGIEKLADLEGPEADQEFTDKFNDLNEQQLDVSEQAVEALRAEDFKALEEHGNELSKLSDESDALADEYGMSDCGSAGSEA